MPVVWIGLAELELRDRRYDEALELAQRIKTHFPGNVAGHDVEAAAYRGKGDIEQAVAAAESALRKRGPEGPSARTESGSIEAWLSPGSGPRHLRGDAAAPFPEGGFPAAASYR